MVEKHQFSNSNKSQINDEMFHPRSVAIFGPSEKRGYYWIHSLINNRFKGPIYPIHPRKDSGDGLPFYKSVFEVLGPIDYAIIAVPARMVLQVLKDCVKRGIKYAHIFSSGFSEIGEEGKALEKEIKEFIDNNPIRVLGPNCMGIYCPRSGLAFRTDSDQMDLGNVAFVSQSGGIAINLVLRGQQLNLLFSKVVSTGNGIDITPGEVIRYLADDNETKVIGAYLENLGKSVEEGRMLFEALKYASKKKPVVIWRGGRTEVGASAASSHTGALASNNAIWDAVVKQTGIISVRTFQELIDTLIGFQVTSKKSRPKGPGVGLVSVSGGVGVTNADLIADAGLTVPKLHPETIRKIEQDNMVTSVGVSAANPIDLGTSYFALSVVDKVIQHLVDDPNISAVIIELSNHYIYNTTVLRMKDYPKMFMEQILKTVKKARRRVKKPIFLTMPIVAYERERLVDRTFFIKKSIPVFDTVEGAGLAIAHLYEYQKFSENNLDN